jgi:hypothetical protein
MMDITVYLYLTKEDILKLASLFISEDTRITTLSNGDKVMLCNGELEIEHEDEWDTSA